MWQLDINNQTPSVVPEKCITRSRYRYPHFSPQVQILIKNDSIFKHNIRVT